MDQRLPVYFDVFNANFLETAESLKVDKTGPVIRPVARHSTI